MVQAFAEDGRTLAGQRLWLSAGDLVVGEGDKASQVWSCDIGVAVAENLHPVTNPAVDTFGNIYTTFSGSRGQKVPVAVYRIDLNFNLRPFLNDMMNATAIAIGPDGLIYISSRFDGIVYQVTPSGNMTVFVEGMGVATGICFDRDENLYVGDRSGTIFKISRSRQIYVFDVAHRLGYGSDVAFSRAFRRHTGVSPATKSLIPS